jgi:hypothetical protein
MPAKKTTKKAPVKPPVKTNPAPPAKKASKPTQEAGIRLDEKNGFAISTVGGMTCYTCLKCGVMFSGEDRLPMIQAHVRVCKG